MTRFREFRLGDAGLAMLCVALVFCAEAAATKTIAVRVLVDEEEPRTRQLWQETLGRRLDQASSILAQYGSIRFSVTKFSTWDSNDATLEFTQSLKEFEKETNPFPAELAIGFTSQYRLQRGLSNLGGTRGPLRKHILIREGSPNVLETERLEVLVHELAHYLGAAHSSQSDSVMRPVLGDGQSRAKSFRIKLDDQNAKIVRLVSSEMATFHIQSMHQLQVRSKLQVRDAYSQLAREFPDDVVAKRYALIMDKSIKASMAARQRQIQAAKANRAKGGKNEGS